MEDIAKMGFWLAVGLVIAASIIAEAMKERERERQRQETVREMMRLEAEGKLTPETLKYMRERDAAEQEAAREASRNDRVGAGIVAFVVGAGSFGIGLLVFALVLRATAGVAVAVVATLVVWVGGGRLALSAYRAIARGKKDSEKASNAGA